MSKCQKVEHVVSQEEVQPWHRIGGMEHICELRKTTSVIYGILVTILRMMYSSKKGRTFGCPNVVWKQDSQKTQIWIDTELRWEDARPDFRPAIYVSLGEIKYDRPPTIDGQGRTDISPDGEYQYERTGMATASIVHICDTVGAACALADNTESYLSSLQGEIADQYCFEHFVVTGRVARQKASENDQASGRDKIASVVQVQFDWTDAWMVKVESPILKSVDVFPMEHRTVAITGTNVDLASSQIEIEFGDMVSDTDVSVAK